MEHPAPEVPCRAPALQRVRAVVLDVDGTLYRQGPLRRRMALELLAFAALRPARGIRTIRVLRAFRRMREQLRGAVHEAGSCEALQYERPAALLGVSPEAVREIVAVWMEQRPLRHLRSLVRPGLEAFLAACGGSGVRVGALSDYPPQWKLQALGVRPFFGLELCSTDHGIDAFKPSPAGILAACRSWRLPPEVVLCVGDRADVDGEAARAAGAPFVLMGRSGNGGGEARDFHDLLRLAGLQSGN